MNQEKAVWAWTDPASHLRLWIPAGVGAAADLLSKWLVWRWLAGPPEKQHEIIRGILSFSLARNPGIAFGIKLPWALIMATTLAGIVLIIYLFQSSTRDARVGHIGMGLILAGAVGNLVDRVLPPHTVRDFIDFPFWPTFNLADAFLCVGVGLLAVSILAGQKQTPNT